MISRLNENLCFGPNSRVESETKISQNFRLPYCASALHLLQENSVIAKISCVLYIISMYYWKYSISFCSSFSVNASIISTQCYNAQRSTCVLVNDQVMLMFTINAFTWSGGFTKSMVVVVLYFPLNFNFNW